MKNFLEHITEIQKTYDFRIKLADIDPSELQDKIKNALDAYGLDSLSEAKRLPIKENDIDFPNISNCQIYLMDAVLKYPCNDAQLRAIIADRVNIPANQVIVVSPNHPEEQRRWNLEGNDVREFKQGDAVLDKEYSHDECPCAEEASKQYVEAGTLLKELSKFKFDIAGSEKADGKTTNDLPVGTTSPIKGK